MTGTAVATRYDAGVVVTRVHSGDFNGDGRPDFAVTNATNALTLFLNTSQ